MHWIRKLLSIALLGALPVVYASDTFTPDLGNWATYASLVAAIPCTSALNGAKAWTSDAGPVWCQGASTTWVTVNNFTTLVVPAQSGSTEPIIFNASSSAVPGDVIFLQGTNFNSTPKVWMATGGAPIQLTVVNSYNEPTQLTAQLPATVANKGGIIVWMTNTNGTSNSVALNAAVPLHLDALQIVPSGAFRIVGKNLLTKGIVPAVTVQGLAATINMEASTSNILSVTAPSGITTTASVVITVDNGNGTGPHTMNNSQSQIAVVTGATGDPLYLGVGWAAGFTWANSVTTVASCNGATDSAAINTAITTRHNAGGGTVLLPAGTCGINTTVNMQSNVILAGQGIASTNLIYSVNYPIFAVSFDLVGLRDFTLTNSGSVTDGVEWKTNTRSFFQRVKFVMGSTDAYLFTGNTNMVVEDSLMTQAADQNFQNIFLFTDTSGLLFTRNTVTSIDGSKSFLEVNDGLILNNHFCRDATNQNEGTVIATHQLAVDGAYRLSIIGNLLDVINGPVTNLTRNDGETILSEDDGGANDTSGVVTAATTTTFTDTGNTLNLNGPQSGTQRFNFGVAIVSGTGMGQSRDITAYNSGTHVATVDYAWLVTPDTTSHYSAAQWNQENSIVADNVLVGNPRGIWLYAESARNVDIVNNKIFNGGGIYLKAQAQSGTNARFDPQWDVKIAGNTVTNNDGVWMSYIDALFLNNDTVAFGPAFLGLEIDNNILVPNTPNVLTNGEDDIHHEGFQNLVFSTASGVALNAAIPMVDGTILMNDACAICTYAFSLSTGDVGLDLITNTPLSAAANYKIDGNPPTNSQTGNAMTGASTSQGTVIQ